MKTETINGVPCSTYYAWVREEIAEPQYLETLDDLAGMAMRDVRDVDPARLALVIAEKARIVQEDLERQVKTTKRGPYDTGFATCLVLERAEVRLQCCREGTTTHPQTPTFQGVELPYILNMERTAADRMTVTEESVE